jgi:hypothetical protein
MKGVSFLVRERENVDLSSYRRELYRTYSKPNRSAVVHEHDGGGSSWYFQLRVCREPSFRSGKEDFFFF